MPTKRSGAKAAPDRWRGLPARRYMGTREHETGGPNAQHTSTKGFSETALSDGLRAPTSVESVDGKYFDLTGSERGSGRGHC